MPGRPHEGGVDRRPIGGEADRPPLEGALIVDVDHDVYDLDRDHDPRPAGV